MYKPRYKIGIIESFKDPENGEESITDWSTAGVVCMLVAQCHG